MRKIWQRAFNILLMHSDAIWVSVSASMSPVLLSFKDSFSQICSLPVVTYRFPSCWIFLSWNLPGDRKPGSCHDLYQSYFKAFLQSRQERRAKGRLLLPQVRVSEERTQLGWRVVGKALQSQTFSTSGRENMDLKPAGFAGWDPSLLRSPTSSIQKICLSRTLAAQV